MEEALLQLNRRVLEIKTNYSTDSLIIFIIPYYRWLNYLSKLI